MSALVTEVKFKVQKYSNDLVNPLFLAKIKLVVSIIKVKKFKYSTLQKLLHF